MLSVAFVFVELVKTVLQFMIGDSQMGTIKTVTKRKTKQVEVIIKLSPDEFKNLILDLRQVPNPKRKFKLEIL